MPRLMDCLALAAATFAANAVSRDGSRLCISDQDANALVTIDPAKREVVSTTKEPCR